MLQNDESTFLFGRRPDRVIENACFDSKLQYSRNTCERKQAKRREFLLCGVSRHSMYPCHIHIKDNARQTNRKQKTNILKKQGIPSETNYHYIRRECFPPGK